MHSTKVLRGHKEDAARLEIRDPGLCLAKEALLCLRLWTGRWGGMGRMVKTAQEALQVHVDPPAEMA